MRTSKNFFANLVCIYGLCLGVSMFSCEKADFTLTKSVPSSVGPNAVAKTTQSIPFYFALITSHCIAGGIGLTVDIENPSEYAFLWEVNGNHGGHEISTLPCLCGDSATVHVMRLADGVSISKSVALPGCNTEKK